MAQSRRKSTSADHPITRFRAPSNIEAGRPLKELIGPELVNLIGESIASVHSDFPQIEFRKRAIASLDDLELKERARHIALALQNTLPADFKSASRILVSSFGPPLTSTEGNGLTVFFYLPHAAFIATAGIDDFEAGMQANHELTQRFSAEFSIRPFLERYPKQALSLLKKWTKSLNPHVRRLVSEGTRPRLPWGSRLRVFESKPESTLALLELLKNDPELYVRRSVANHLGDLLKDHPDIIYETCDRWIDEVVKKSTPVDRRNQLFWIIRHAVRLPAKKGIRRAAELRLRAK